MTRKRYSLKRFFPRTCLLLFAAVALLSGCSGTSVSDPDGLWDPMQWQAEQSLTREGSAYVIGAEGGSAAFSCSNYSHPWMEAAAVGEEVFLPDYESGDYHHIHGEWFEAGIEDNRLVVTFGANEGDARSVTVSVTAGDIFYTFRFTQQAGSE